MQAYSLFLKKAWSMWSKRIENDQEEICRCSCIVPDYWIVWSKMGLKKYPQDAHYLLKKDKIHIKEQQYKKGWVE